MKMHCGFACLCTPGGCNCGGLLGICIATRVHDVVRVQPEQLICRHHGVCRPPRSCACCLAGAWRTSSRWAWQPCLNRRPLVKRCRHALACLLAMPSCISPQQSRCHIPHQLLDNHWPVGLPTCAWRMRLLPRQTRRLQLWLARDPSSLPHMQSLSRYGPLASPPSPPLHC